MGRNIKTCKKCKFFKNMECDRTGLRFPSTPSDQACPEFYPRRG